MIRIISFRKAALAGIAGAVAWELVLRALLVIGLPFADLVRMLGLVVFPDGPAWAGWTAGMAIHAVVGVIWAVFYAYFFWSVLNWRPVFQGMAFAAIPSLLALLIVYPQFHLMHADASWLSTNPLRLMLRVSWGERLGLMLGHLIFGAVLGTLYTRPVGYPACSDPPRPASAVKQARRRPIGKARPHANTAFMFATGIECSYPTLENGRWRFDQLAASGHYRRWPDDLQLCVEIGVTHLRYGPPLHLTLRGPGRYDWSPVDPMLAAMHEIGLTPIVDLCHFGLPDWLQDFQNPEIPDALADYAQAFAHRYPWVRFYTPVNEMYVCAKLSALDGVWNEQRRDERAFLTAVRHLAKANLQMMGQIRTVRPDAVFVTSESGEFYQASTPAAEVVRVADFENERRFLPLDLVYARPVAELVRSYLKDNGMPDDEYAWFMAQEPPRRCILGVDYYTWNEKLIDSTGRPQALGELFGWYVVAQQYWDRYRRPMMHTETNHMDARQGARWLWRQWHNVQLIRRDRVPVVGFTWYSLTDQVDWDIALSQPLGNVSPVGLFDLNRQPRAAGQAYKHLIATFQDQPGLAECPALAELLR